MSEKRKIRKSRQTLKNYFSSGALPEERHFHDLIDSTLNMEDEGFNKTPEDGLQVFTRVGEQGESSQSLISFFREGQKLGGPLWRIRFDRGFDSLQLVHPPDEAPPSAPAGAGGAAAGAPPAPPDPILSLSPGRKLGVNLARPEVDLDVGGIVRSHGRSGTVPPEVVASEVVADGKWHRITGRLTGCQALEVLAGVGGTPGRGNYALVHAIALNAYNPRGWFFNLFRRKNRIRVHQAYYRSRADKLKLQWSGDAKGYWLEIKTQASYKMEKGAPAARILFHVTQLWRYPTMQAPKEQGEGERGKALAGMAPPETLPSGSAPDRVEAGTER